MTNITNDDDDLLFSLQGLVSSNTKVQLESLQSLFQILQGSNNSNVIPPPSSKKLHKLIGKDITKITKIYDNLFKQLLTTTTNTNTTTIKYTLTILRALGIPPNNNNIQQQTYFNALIQSILSLLDNQQRHHHHHHQNVNHGELLQDEYEPMYILCLESLIELLDILSSSNSSSSTTTTSGNENTLIKTLQNKAFDVINNKGQNLLDVLGGIITQYKICSPKSTLPTTLASLVEVLCFENKTYASLISRRLPTLPSWLFRYGLSSKCTPETQMKCLRALVNLTNECSDGVASVIDGPPPGVGLLLISLEISMKNVLKSRNGLPVSPITTTSSSPRQQQQQHTIVLDQDTQFDICLLLLSLIANIVEDENKGLDAVANGKVSNDVNFGIFLVDAFVQSLPPRAAADLSSGDTHTTIEFGWTPEELILSAHSCLVLGCLVRNESIKEQIRKALPGRRGFAPLIQVLDGFLIFQQQAGVLTIENAQSIQKVAGFLKDAGNGLMLPPAFLNNNNNDNVVVVVKQARLV
jgi:hypothetical protein